MTTSFRTMLPAAPLRVARAERAGPAERFRWAAIAGTILPLVPAAALLAGGSVAAAAVYHAIGRLAYVGTVGAMLRRRSRHGGPARRREEDFERFRLTASALMANDAVGFAALALLSAGSFRPTVPIAAVLAIAAGLIALGIGIKTWAARALPPGGYYWRDFFVPPPPGTAPAGGPYRLLSNPMYSLGYAHAYGLALGLLSWPALLAAVLDQSAILIFHALVERPHVRSLYGPERTRPW